jgi:hypothetical protein
VHFERRSDNRHPGMAEGRFCGGGSPDALFHLFLQEIFR